jgi:hypothetical protein
MDMNVNKEEKLFFTSFALELVDDSVESIIKNDIPSSLTFIDYLRDVCNYLTINFDAPNYIGMNSKVIYALLCLKKKLVALSLSLKKLRVITGGSSTTECRYSN